MKSAASAALLIVVGIVVVYLGLNASRKVSLLDVGSLDVHVTRRKADPLVTGIGVAAVAGGIVLLIRTRRQP